MKRLLAMMAMLILGVAFSSVAFADDLKADPVHSFVVFDVHHLGAGYVYGTFAGPSGTVGYDASDLSKTTFDLTVDADSIDTRNANRDKDLKGPDFFDVSRSKAPA
jgi:polyisoprenoid-binding protein YceI